LLALEPWPKLHVVTSALKTSVHIPALDGVRGLAIPLVLVCHLSEHFQFSALPLQWMKAVAFAGWTGVDLFFVLSGFLITGILWDAKGGRGYFRNFYARRTIRIFPLYFAALAILFIAIPALSPEYAISSRHYWAWFCTYSVDFLIALKGFQFPGHFWTLSVEEHFYLVWPLLVYKLSRRALMATSVSLMVAALVVRVAMVLANAPSTAIYVLTPCRMDGLALGAFIALALRGPDGLQTLVRLARLVLPASALLWVTLLVLQGQWSQYGPVPQTVGYLVAEMFYGSLLVFTLASSRVAAAASIRSLRFLGKISYGVYVIHVFVVFLVSPFFARGVSSNYSIVFSAATHLVGARTFGAGMLVLDGAAYIALAVGLSVGAALLSWQILELPCLRLRRYFTNEVSTSEPSAAAYERDVAGLHKTARWA